VHSAALKTVVAVKERGGEGGLPEAGVDFGFSATSELSLSSEELLISPASLGDFRGAASVTGGTALRADLAAGTALEAATLPASQAVAHVVVSHVRAGFRPC